MKLVKVFPKLWRLNFHHVHTRAYHRQAFNTALLAMMSHRFTNNSTLNFDDNKTAHHVKIQTGSTSF